MDRVGLCATCAHVRVIESERGSRFYMCTEAARDPTLRKYPPLPRLTCHGYQRSESESRGPEQRSGFDSSRTP